MSVAPDAAQSGLAQAADGLTPSEELLEAFAHDLTGPISWVIDDARARSGAVVGRVEGHVRRDALGVLGTDLGNVLDVSAQHTHWFHRPLNLIMEHLVELESEIGQLRLRSKDLSNDALIIDMLGPISNPTTNRA